MTELSMANFTDTVINAMGPKASDRTRTVFTAFIKHMHDFTREVKLTPQEWLDACNFLVRAGHKSDEKRNEVILVSDIFGIESLVDFIANGQGSASAEHAIGLTESAILGPFWRENAPTLPYGASIIQGAGEGGEKVLVKGIVCDEHSAPIENAIINVWETAPNGLYEQQDPNQPEYNLRGAFRTDKEGRYAFIGLRPTAYPIPYDGPAGDLLQLMDRHPFRPAHIHFLVRAPGYQELITQIFDRENEYLENDSVFAVKDSLIVDFEPTHDKSDVNYICYYDLRLKSL